jgi:hypothetical protein
MADEKEVEELKEQIEKLSAKNQELIGELRKAKGGLSAEEAARLAGELDSVKAENVKLAAALKKANESIEGLTKDFTQKLSEKSAKIQTMLRTEGLTKSLLDVGVKNPVHLKAAAAMLRELVQVDEDKGEAFVMDGATRKTLSEFIKNWAASDEGKAFIEAPVNVGSGATGGAGTPAGGKIKTRAEFEALDPAARLEFTKSGGKLVD